MTNDNGVWEHIVINQLDSWSKRPLGFDHVFAVCLMIFAYQLHAKFQWPNLSQPRVMGLKELSWEEQSQIYCHVFLVSFALLPDGLSFGMICFSVFLIWLLISACYNALKGLELIDETTDPIVCMKPLPI
jgi:hypothetical protein